MRDGEPRIQLHDATKALQRFFALAHAPLQVGEVVQGLDEVRLQLERALEGKLRGGEFARARDHVAQAVPGMRVARGKLQRLGDELDGLVAASLAHAQHAQVVQGVAVVGLRGEQLQVDRFRLLQAAALGVLYRIENRRHSQAVPDWSPPRLVPSASAIATTSGFMNQERRVGKEWRSRWSAVHYKKNRGKHEKGSIN